MPVQAISDDWRIKLAMPIFLLVDALLARPKVARYLFDRFRTRDNLRTVLKVLSGRDAATMFQPHPTLCACSVSSEHSHL